MRMRALTVLDALMLYRLPVVAIVSMCAMSVSFVVESVRVDAFIFHRLVAQFEFIFLLGHTFVYTVLSSIVRFQTENVGGWFAVSHACFSMMGMCNILVDDAKKEPWQFKVGMRMYALTMAVLALLREPSP